MKHLVLCRHAKSSWKHPVKDLYRPLNARGVLQAPQIARSCIIQPDLVLCSPAVRAWSTAVCYFEERHWDYQLLSVEPRLVEASMEEILAVIRSVEEHVQTLFLFGHNPGFNDLIHWLSDAKPEQDNLVTSGRVTLQADIRSWKSLDKAMAEITEWTVPDKK